MSDNPTYNGIGPRPWSNFIARVAFLVRIRHDMCELEVLEPGRFAIHTLGPPPFYHRLKTGTRIYVYDERTGKLDYPTRKPKHWHVAEDFIWVAP